MEKRNFHVMFLIASLSFIGCGNQMAPLSTRYESAPLLAVAGNTREAGIEVSILGRDGTPVRGLTVTDFSFASGSIVPPGGTALEIKTVVELPGWGGYNLLVIPRNGATWLRGTYIEFLHVSRGSDLGHEVVKLEIP